MIKITSNNSGQTRKFKSIAKAWDFLDKGCDQYGIFIIEKDLFIKIVKSKTRLKVGYGNNSFIINQ